MSPSSSFVDDTTVVPPVHWVPDGLPAAPSAGPSLCPGAYLTPEQGRAVLDAAPAQFPTPDDWQSYADHARLCIQRGAGLMPWPRRSALNPVIRGRRSYAGYSVENVAFESVPGYLVTGNLFRPLHAEAPHPGVLLTHGHARRVEKPEDYDHHGRFDPSTQACGAALARMGAIALSIDMFGNGDSILQVGQEAHRQPFSMTIQAWNAIRALDFLLSLEGVDSRHVAVSGASGGGTQAFLLTSLDPRVSLSVPVVMVSAHFFGGCPCESGLPIHRSAEHFANNVMIAALAAPRPMLVVSDGQDWTLNVPEVEYPFLQRIYALYGAEDNVANVHLPLEGHDYGPSKRAAMYRFVAERFGLNLSAVQNTGGEIDEAGITIERSGPMHVFDDEFPLPASALSDAAGVERALQQLQQ
jgi:dienelactone hydrolase